MLNSARRAALCVLTGIGLTVGAVPSASADVVGPCGDTTICAGHGWTATAQPPGSGGSGGGGDSGSNTCSWNGETVPCWRDDLGWFSEGCYYRLASPQPLESEDVWDGRTSKDGAIYDRACLGNEAPGAVFLASPPAGMRPRTPRQLAFDALGKIEIGLRELHVAPKTDAVVGSPVWLWFDPARDFTGPLSGTVHAPDYDVTTTVTLKQVIWHVDDGPAGQGRVTDVVCDDAGTPFTAGGTPSCSHTFTASSAKMNDHAYTVTVSLLWRVTAHTSTNVDINMADFTWRTDLDKPVLRIPVNEVQVLN
ncbi:hypothetical protein [Kitasatospora sp. CB01950]|uniref:hypothetical protein n=1 Tax=Kitasatospora sp. CB01950 TaxID=1703930 RepID=UPI00093EA9B8|nr:hypothetical protein [Kitasatospora sp. CB01950]